MVPATYTAAPERITRDTFSVLTGIGYPSDVRNGVPTVTVPDPIYERHVAERRATEKARRQARARQRRGN